jgi:hypothetical protein
MEPKGFLIYPYGGIAFSLSNFGHNQNPPIALTKIIQSMVFIKYLHEGNAFLLSFINVM